MNQPETELEVSVVTVGGLEILQGDLQTTVELIGSTAPEEMVNVMVTVPSEVEAVNVEVGDVVTEGQVLFTLDAESVQNQVTQAEIAVTMAEVGIANANAGVEQARLSYNMSVANYEMQLDSYEFSRNNLANYEELLAQGVVSQMEYDQVKLQSSDETLNVLEAQKSQAAAALNQAKLGVDSANASLLQAQEGLESALSALEDMSITAPASGVITASYVTENNFASNASPAMVIQSLDTIIVNASVTESLVSKIKKGDQVDVVINALDGAVFTGTVDTVSSAADQRTLLFPITVKVENKDHAIKPGMFATVEVVKAVSKNALYVPSEAVILRDNFSYIYMMDGESRALRTQVETGIDNGFFTEIVSGAKAGDLIVTKGIGLIDDNSTVKLIRRD